jgi:predicted nuclease of predicted toxin-antitoxin system
LTKRKSFRVPDRLTILLDQNVPQAVVSWLKLLKPTWAVFHTGDVGLSGKADEEVFAWAQQQSSRRCDLR